MTQQEHERLLELIPAYAIGAADADERGQVDAHLPACAECRALLADYRAMSEDLLFAAPVAAAPVGVTERLRKQLGQPARAPARWNVAFLRRPAFALGMAALALLVLTNVYWANRVGRLEQQTNEVAALAEAPGIPLRVAVAADPTDPAYDAHGPSGVVYAQPGSRIALLCVYALPELEADKTYQAWLVENGKRDSAGTFRVNHEGYGVLIINAGKPVTDYQQVGITVEPAGGSPAPTTPRVIGGAL